MPHIIVEYTDNIKSEANIPHLLEKLNEVLIERNQIYPVGGIRSRALELKDYRVADGREDDAFVHTTFKIGRGRTQEQKEETSQAMFSVIKAHFSPLLKKRYLALSFELVEFTHPTLKENNIHNRFS